MRGSSTLAPASSGVDGTTSGARSPWAIAASASVSSPRRHVVDVRARVLRQPERDRRVALRVEVDEQRLVAGLGDRGGRGSRRWWSCPPRPSGWRLRDRAHGGSKVRAGSVGTATVLLLGSGPNVESSRVRGAQPSGRLRAIPGRRGKPLAAWARSCGTRAGGGARGPRTGSTRRTSLGSIPSCSRPRPRPRPPPPRRARPSRRPATPLGRSSGAAYSTSTASGARARAVTAS